eukprot:2609173-Amphidinium_carterae.1
MDFVANVISLSLSLLSSGSHTSSLHFQWYVADVSLRDGCVPENQKTTTNTIKTNRKRKGSKSIAKLACDKEYVVIGVRPHNGELALWFQPRALIAQGKHAACVLGRTKEAMHKDDCPEEPILI